MGFGAPKLKDLQLTKLNLQKKESICKILLNNIEKGFGFLCFILKSKIKLLITDTNTLNKADINYKKELTIVLNNEKKEIKTSIPRATYMDENNKIMILEIKDEDNFEKFNFLDFDESIDKNDPNKAYKKKEIYILPYELKDENKYPAGKIQSIDKRDYTIEHDCNNIDKKDKFLGPILLLDNYQVIGFNKKKDYGILLINFIDEFIKILEEEKNKKEQENREKEENKDNRVNTNGNNDNEKNEIKNEDGENINNEMSDSQAVRNVIDDNKKVIEGEKVKIKSYKTDNPKIDDQINRNKNYLNILRLEIKVDDKDKDVYFIDNNNKKDEKKKENNIRVNGFMEEINKYKNDVIVNIKSPNNDKNKVVGLNKFNPKVIGIYTVEIKFPRPIKNCGYMFYNCYNIINVDLKKFDFSEITNMNDMFSGCTNLRHIEFSDENIEKVKDISYMFSHCINLEEIDLSKFNTKNVTSMAGMFQHCENIKEINLQNFHTNEVTQLSCMFNNCYNLSKITFSNDFRIYNVMFMPWMFYGCENLKTIDLSSFEIINLKDMTDMFEGCDILDKIYVNEYYIRIFKASNKNIEKKFYIK